MVAPVLASLAISAASKFIPEFIGSAFSDSKAKSVADAITKTAVGYVKDKYDLDDVTELEAVKKVENDREFFMQHRKDFLSLIDMELKDIQHAREHNQEDGVVKNLSYIVMIVNPFLIALCIGALIYVSTAGLAGAVTATVSATLGAAINHFFLERQQVMNYRFGSSLGSKMKNMSNRK